MKNTVNVDRMDRERFSQVADLSNTVKGLDTSDSKHDLLEDAFGAFYKYSPRVLEKVPVERRLHQQVMSQMMELAEYKQLRNYTQADAVNATGALSAVEDILASVPDDLQRAQDAAELASADLDKILNNKGQIDVEDVKSAIARLKISRKKLDQEFYEAEDIIRATCRTALNKAIQNVENVNTAIKVLGCGNADIALPVISTSEKAKFASMLQDNIKLQKIMRLSGRFARVAEAKQRQKMDNTKNTVDGVEAGSNIADVLPSEIALLADKDLEVDFFRKFAEDSLLQYKISGKDKVGKGPVVVAIDCSGSMSGDGDTWSKAIALAMYTIARRQKRDYSIMLFNTQVRQSVYVSKNTKNPEQLIQVLMAGCGGGTSFEAPLNEFLNIVKNKDIKSDLIFITDGICSVNQQWLADFNKQRKTLEFSVRSVIIGRDNGVLASFSNEVVSLLDAIEDNETEAHDTLFTI